MSNQYGHGQIVKDSSLRLCYDMNDANCYPGSGNIIYNLADSTNYPSMSPISLNASNMTYRESEAIALPEIFCTARGTWLLASILTLPLWGGCCELIVAKEL